MNLFTNYRFIRKFAAPAKATLSVAGGYRFVIRNIC